MSKQERVNTAFQRLTREQGAELATRITELESLVQQREQERDAERAKRLELQRLLKDECSPK